MDNMKPMQIKLEKSDAESNGGKKGQGYWLRSTEIPALVLP